MKIIKTILKSTALAVLTLLIFGTVTLLFLTRGADIDLEKLSRGSCSLQIVDAKNNRLNIDGQYISHFDDVSKNLINAFTSIEDKRFFSHNGVDLRRVAGSAIANLRSRKKQQGGSTITQQLIKNTHLTTDKSVIRKAKEMRLAMNIEKLLTKEEIFVAYLNNIYFGNGVYGAENAARYYFDKTTANLTANEAAYLAALVKAPTKLSENYNLAEKRKNLVLREMLHDGKLTENEFKNLLATPIVFADTKPRWEDSISPLIIKRAKDLLGFSEQDLYASGYTIHVGIDTALEKYTQDLVRNLSHDTFIVAIDNTTCDIVLCKFPKNVVFDSFQRQPGSIIKPIIPYAPAFEDNILTCATKIKDEPCSFAEYSPKNFNDIYRGDISVRDAIIHSSNIVAVKSLEYVSVKRAVEYASSIGLPVDSADEHLALALGGMTYGVHPLKIVELYSAFACGGSSCIPKLITSIDNERGETMFSSSIEKKSIMRDDTAFLITDMLAETAKKGTAKKLRNLPYAVAAKTGTAGNTDAWTVAFTPHHTIAVWCGNADRTPLPQQVTGGTIPCSIAEKVLSKLYENGMPPPFEPPNSIVRLAIDKCEYEVSGKITPPTMPIAPYFYEYFSTYNLPQEVSADTPEPNAQIRLDHFGYAVISISCDKRCRYTIYKCVGNSKRKIRLKITEHYTGIVTFKDIVDRDVSTVYYADVQYGKSIKTVILGMVRRDSPKHL